MFPPAQNESLEAWRERIFSAVFFFGVLLASIPYVSSVRLALRLGQEAVVVIYTLAYLWGVVITLVRRMPFRARVFSGLAIFYVVGLTRFFASGPVGSGRVWLFAFAVFATIFIGLKAGLVAAGMNIITLALLTWLTGSGRLDWRAMTYSGELWNVTALTFVFLSTSVVVALAMLVRSLENGLEKERALAARLATANTQLEKEIVERKRAKAETHRRAEELAALQATVLDITATHDLPTLLQTVVERAASLLNAAGGGMYLCDQDHVRCVVSYNTPQDYTGTLLKYGEGAAGTVAQTGQPLIIDDYRAWSGRAAAYEAQQPFRAVLSAPMIWQGQVTGVIHVLQDARDRCFTQADLELLTLFANHAAIAVENARLREQMQCYAAELEQRVTARTRDLERQKQELARSNAELQQFAYVASHDLQEPLRMVTSYVQLLERRYRGQLDADADDFIAFAVDGAARMQQLIQDLLAYSRVGTRGQPFAPADCQVVLNQVLSDLQVSIQESDAVVTRDPLPTVMADATQLGQLFQNLVGNAIKFRGDRRPEIHVSAERREDGHWLFSVRDNGIGIEPQYAERIFLIFQRLHTRDEYPGTGIGLAICKRIVARHGGRIWVESEPGKGSIFYFTLPERV
jgi:signal transduction histidine kinase